TWPRGVEKLFALRDFDIRDASGNPAVQARSCWLVIDIEKRRPLRPQSVMDSIPQNEGQDALPFAASLEERPYLQQVAERQALYTDVDYNSHVNNVSYIRWIEDALDPALLEKAQRMRLDINYLSEILPGEVTGIRAAEIETAAASAVPVASPVAVLPPSHAFAFDGKKDQPPDNPFAFRAELRLWH
ncbi:MAG: thioesterase, partial [Treponema sp.]|nr:thioesterase [Treponema sp.]